MHDLKKIKQKSKKVRRNRRKQEKKSPDLRKLLQRMLYAGVTIFSGMLLVVGGFFMVQLLMVSELFQVEQVAVEGNDRLTEEQIVALSDIQIGVNTFNLDLDLIGRKIEENLWVKEARVQRIFPRQVAITLKERNPVAIINLGYLYYLDDQGEVFKVLDAADKLDYLIITGFDYDKAKGPDTKYAQYLKQIVGLLADLRERRLFSLDQVSEIHYDAAGGLSLFTLEGGVKVKLGYGDYRKKLARLERIYAQLQSKLPILDYIDLNVDEKVIVRIKRLNKTAKG